MLTSLLNTAMALPAIALAIGIAAGWVAANRVKNVDEREARIADAAGTMQALGVALFLPWLMGLNCAAFLPIGPDWLINIGSQIFPFEVLTHSSWWVTLLMQIGNGIALGVLAFGGYESTRNLRIGASQHS